ncbi:MAG: hypothetical protein C0485_00475 [Pirellula sp.]|nr:hypothetical protein [Pirellula sp.]
MFPLLSSGAIGIIAQVYPATIACAKEFAQLVARRAIQPQVNDLLERGEEISDLGFVISDLK